MSDTMILWAAFVVFAVSAGAIFVYSLRSLEQRADVEERLMQTGEAAEEE